MSAWTVAIDLAEDRREEGASPMPTFLRIARAVAADIRRGRLRAGDALPGSRTLATSLGVHRNTVLAAYRELGAEGWVTSDEARGTFVSKTIPDVVPRRFAVAAPVADAVAARTGFTLPASRLAALPAPAPLPGPLSRLESAPLSLGGGIPDVRLVPAAEIARAMRRILRRSPVEVLSYGDPAGPASLRRALAAMAAATRGVAASAENVLVTRGSQMGIDLAARTLVEPGDVVVVEALGYRPAWEALRAAGARLVPLPVDERGLDVPALARLCAETRVRGVYVTPHHQYPTTVTLAPARRLELLALAHQHRFFVLEDDYDHEFHYEGRPVLPLASADVHGVVVYLGTLSKVLAPGLRVGFMIGPEPLVQRLAAARRVVDRQGDALLETAIADLLEEGAIQRHIRRTKRVYQARREHLASLLTTRLGGALSVHLPSGGTALWARVAPDVSADAWVAEAEKVSLVLQGGRHFAFDGKARPHLRIGFAQHDEREAREAVRRMEVALAAARRVSARSTPPTPRALPALRSSP
ncbi:MAG: transcriptional regulator, GntR family with aminotransferase domain [Labilithrix sp.]|nr:transcriptional regulator, GntR family with aminotransferase domain [Labilithrix sp.]